MKCGAELLNSWRKSSDFPVINPAFSGGRNRYVYAGTSSGSRPMLPHFPFDSVVKLDISSNSAQTWSTGSRRFIGEPIFVPKETGGGAEDDGYILVVEVKKLIDEATRLNPVFIFINKCIYLIDV